MFVLQSTLDIVKAELIGYKLAFNQLMKEHNNLVDRINEKGGEEFLQGNSTQFTKDEIKTLIILCHPDKHNNSIVAKDITH